MRVWRRLSWEGPAVGEVAEGCGEVQAELLGDEPKDCVPDDVSELAAELEAELEASLGDMDLAAALAEDLSASDAANDPEESDHGEVDLGNDHDDPSVVCDDEMPEQPWHTMPMSDDLLHQAVTCLKVFTIICTCFIIYMVVRHACHFKLPIHACMLFNVNNHSSKPNSRLMRPLMNAETGLLQQLACQRPPDQGESQVLRLRPKARQRVPRQARPNLAARQQQNPRAVPNRKARQRLRQQQKHRPNKTPGQRNRRQQQSSGLKGIAHTTRSDGSHWKLVWTRKRLSAEGKKLLD